MEKVENEERDKVVTPAEKHYADFEPGAIPVAPDGGIAPGYGLEPASSAPAMTAEHCVCVRGPCRYYWHLVTMSGEGNPEGTWEKLGIPAPRQHHHTCLVNPGMETDLTDDCVFACSKWDPLSAGELKQIDARRRAYEKTVRKEVPDDEGDE